MIFLKPKDDISENLEYFEKLRSFHRYIVSKSFLKNPNFPFNFLW